MPKRFFTKPLKAVAVGLVLLWSAGPIYLIISSAFKLQRDIFSVQPKLFLFEPTLRNFVALVNEWPQFFYAMANSTVVTIFSAILTVIFSAMAGFVYSRHVGTVLKLSAFGLIFVRMFPPIVITIPLFPWANVLALNDTRTILVLLYVTFYVSLGSWIMKSFFDQIPREIDEAAMMDGASSFAAFTRILLPIAAPGMVAVGVFVMVFAWNEFLFAFILTSTIARTAPVAISEMTNSVTASIGACFSPHPSCSSFPLWRSFSLPSAISLLALPLVR